MALVARLGLGYKQFNWPYVSSPINSLRLVVDNRVFLLGLDKPYRDATKRMSGVSSLSVRIDLPTHERSNHASGIRLERRTE